MLLCCSSPWYVLSIARFEGYEAQNMGIGVCTTLYHYPASSVRRATLDLLVCVIIDEISRSLHGRSTVKRQLYASRLDGMSIPLENIPRVRPLPPRLHYLIALNEFALADMSPVKPFR